MDIFLMESRLKSKKLKKIKRYLNDILKRRMDNYLKINEKNYRISV